MKHTRKWLVFLFFTHLSFAQSGNYNDTNPASRGLVYRLVDNVSSFSVSVGQLYQGGIVFYVDETGQHGLSVALTEPDSDQELADGSSINSTASGSAIGAGFLNSTVLALSSTVTWLAGAVLQYGFEEDGITRCDTTLPPTSLCYGQWYVGSVAEYTMLSERFDVVNAAIVANGGTPITSTGDAATYWTSTINRSSTTQAYPINLSTGTVALPETNDKLHSGRAIRQF